MAIAKSCCICIAVGEAYSALLMHFLENVKTLFCVTLIFLGALISTHGRYTTSLALKGQTSKSSKLGGMEIVLENASE